jgi:hypothetical protein
MAILVSILSPPSSVLIKLTFSGYGNFNNARRLVRKLEQRGIAGVCLEDKLFPKTNSLLEVRSGALLSDLLQQRPPVYAVALFS